MLKAKNYNGKAIVKYIEEKMDGHRVYIIKNSYGVQAITRANCDIWDKLQNCPFADLVRNLPDRTELDCELHAPGYQATSVKTMINESNPLLQLTPFAIPAWSGFDTRDEDYQSNRLKITDLGFIPVKRRCDLEHHFLTDSPLSNGVVSAFKRIAEAADLEGFVLKEAHYSGWWKIKPTATVDCVVTGYEISDSDSFAGGLKGIEVSVWKGNELVVIANTGSGFDSDYRMSVNPESLVGKVCEIEYDSLAAKGRLKFPRFIRWREEKTSEECTIDQLS